MTELCQTHKLALAGDGKCVLCRRPQHAISFDPAEESIAARFMTAVLGLGMLASIAALGYSWTIPPPSQSTRHTALAPAFRPSERTALATAALSDAGASEESELAAAVEQQGVPAAKLPPEAPKRHSGPSTIGRRIVDPKLAAARREVKVVMYSAPWCYICDRARSFLQAREVDLEEHDVDHSADAAKQLSKLNKSGSIPTFLVEHKVIIGFHPWGLEDAIDEAAGEHYCQGDLEAAVCERPRASR